MAGFILILAIIVLGGTIATVGDRIGSRVGKARLSLFNLRPRSTAVVVTILTGSLIAASTLGILFATSKELRDAVFRIETIQRQRRQAEADLTKALEQKQEMQTALAGVSQDLGTARNQLQQVNRTLSSALERQRQTQTRLDRLQQRFLKAQQELQQFSRQSQTLKAEVTRLDQERQRLIGQRDQVQGRLSQANQQRKQLEVAVRMAQNQKGELETAVTAAQSKLQEVSNQRSQLLDQQQRLQKEITTLESSRKRLQADVEDLVQGLRFGNIAVRAGQVLASASFQNIKDRQSALSAIEALLRQARREALVRTNPSQISPDSAVVQITNTHVERLAQQLQDGQPYVVRILSAANYLKGEPLVIVVPQIARNQVVLPEGERLASVTVNPSRMNEDQLLSQVQRLFTQSNQRAIQSGVLPDPVTGEVGEFRQIDLFKFVLSLKQYEGEIEVAAITPQAVFTSGPLKLSLVAIRNQKVILKSS
jgi:uncharacterized protein (DUF3084 family)